MNAKILKILAFVAVFIIFSIVTLPAEAVNFNAVNNLVYRNSDGIVMFDMRTGDVGVNFGAVFRGDGYGNIDDYYYGGFSYDNYEYDYGYSDYGYDGGFYADYGYGYDYYNDCGYYSNCYGYSYGNYGNYGDYGRYDYAYDGRYDRYYGYYY